MAVNQETEGIIGKFFYYSTSSILIPKLKFIEIGRAYGLPKFKPAKESKASAYRCATTAVKDRVTVKSTTVHLWFTVFTAGTIKKRMPRS